MTGGILSTLIALALAFHATKFQSGPSITFWLLLAVILAAYWLSLVSGANEDRVIWHYGTMLIVGFGCPV